jgi:hypothetical protein
MIARTLYTWRNGLVYAALLLVLAILLIVSPAEATLGQVVKIVYAHGAAERIAEYAYVIAGGLGLVSLVLQRASLARWTQATIETAIVFWLAQIVVSLPAQMLAWGGITLTEPRVAGALWILGLTTLVYLVARWINDPGWIALAAIANTIIFFIVLRGAVNILHPFDPILGSNSLTIKGFYAAIVLTMGMLALQLVRDRARIGKESHGESTILE